MKSLVAFSFLLVPSLSLAQFGLQFHQTNLPFIGFHYEIADRLRPELRIGTDTYFEEISIEGVLTYDFINNEDYEFYGGVGVRANGFVGVVIPVGLNFYPFTVKKFGFHMELAPILGEADILRGSWGIRYRFLKDD
jgi:hypothetical protein